MKPYYKKFTYNSLFKLFLIAMFSLPAASARAQVTDTSIYYFKIFAEGSGLVEAMQVKTLAESDYFRVVFPSDQFHKFSINEYYKNGKIKSIGTSIAGANPYFLGSLEVQYDGDYASFYPTGKKQCQVHYTNGGKDGDEYQFYPDGKVYCYIKNTTHKEYQAAFGIFTNVVKQLCWECYDKNGNMTCQDGNGEWIEYTEDYSKILMHGPIKKGQRDGKWLGDTQRPDSIKYSYTYKKGEACDGIGYDKTGKAYPFTDVQESAECEKGTVFSFLQSVRNHLKLPDGVEKPDIDTMHVCFIIEKDGSISHFGVLGDLPAEVKEAFVQALKPGSLWSPGKYYGVPFRTLMVIPFYVNRTTTTKTEMVNGSYDPMSAGYNQPKYKYTTTTMQKSVYGNQKLLDF